MRAVVEREGLVLSLSKDERRRAGGLMLRQAQHEGFCETAHRTAPGGSTPISSAQYDQKPRKGMSVTR